MGELTARAAAGVEQLHSFLNHGPVPVSDQQITAVMDSVREFFTSSTFSAEALTGARTAVEIFTGAVLMAVTLFFFLKDGPEIRAFLIGMLPADQRAKARAGGGSQYRRPGRVCPRHGHGGRG